MPLRVLVIWILVLQVFWLGLFEASSRYFQPKDLSSAKIRNLQKKLNESERLVAKLNVSFNQYRDAVANSGLKINDETPWTDNQREVASVLSDAAFKNVPHLQIKANENFEKARSYFVDANYSKAATLFQNFIDDAADNPNLPKAAYFLTESYFATGNIDAALKAIDFLVTQFPETEYSGYGMVRLGTIFNQQSRPEDAAEIFNVVIHQYPKSNAAVLAAKNLKELPL